MPSPPKCHSLERFSRGAPALQPSHSDEPRIEMAYLRTRNIAAKLLLHAGLEKRSRPRVKHTSQRDQKCHLEEVPPGVPATGNVKRGRRSGQNRNLPGSLTEERLLKHSCNGNTSAPRSNSGTFDTINFCTP